MNVIFPTEYPFHCEHSREPVRCVYKRSTSPRMCDYTIENYVSPETRFTILLDKSGSNNIMADCIIYCLTEKFLASHNKISVYEELVK